MVHENSQKFSQNFYCIKCDYYANRKSDLQKHYKSKKHNDTNNDTLNSQFICECGKKYKFHSGYYRHKKVCLYNINSTANIEKSNIIDVKSNEKDENNDMRNMIKDLIKENAKLQNQVSELIPKIGNTINNNTQNNKFNINVFLNEKCKDAINMTDFVKSIEVSLQQLDFTKNNGLVNGLSKTIMDNMNKLSLYERPLHCTDVKRETLYIKDEDTWIKDESKEKIKKAIKKASGKNYNALQDWKIENPDFMSNDSKTDYFTKTITTIGKPTNTIDTKVIKNLCKETYIKDNIY